MAEIGDRLSADQCLSVGDYLVSKNRCFFAIMQGDGNFAIWRGSGPDDCPREAGGVWTTAVAGNYAVANGDYFARMQNDGNFCIYRGKTPSPGQQSPGAQFVWGSLQQGGYGVVYGSYEAVLQDDGTFLVNMLTPQQLTVFNSGAKDPVVSIALDEIQYHTELAKLLSATPIAVDQATVPNHTDKDQSASITFKDTVAQTSGWSNTVGVKVTVSTQFDCTIPVVGVGAKVTLSVEASESYSWNSSTTRSNDNTFQANIVVPPGKTYHVVLTATQGDLTVPYTLHGTVTLLSTVQLANRTITGTYSGVNSYDYQATYTDVTPSASPNATHAVATPRMLAVKKV